MLRDPILDGVVSSALIYNYKWPSTPRIGFVEITDSRVQQTNVYNGVHFNDFVKSNLAQHILKRVIMNGMTGSSWRFKRFDRICLAVNSDKFGSVGN